MLKRMYHVQTDIVKSRVLGYWLLKIEAPSIATTIFRSTIPPDLFGSDLVSFDRRKLRLTFPRLQLYRYATTKINAIILSHYFKHVETIACRKCFIIQQYIHVSAKIRALILSTFFEFSLSQPMTFITSAGPVAAAAAATRASNLEETQVDVGPICHAPSQAAACGHRPRPRPYPATRRPVRSHPFP